MTIRSAILRGFLTLVVISVLLGGALSFYEFRQSLQTEISRNMQRAANALLERIDAYSFERLADIREWQRLELLQDIRVGDLDKRLAHMLGDLRSGHGKIYDAIYCTDQQGRIVAASDAGLIGQPRPPGDVILQDSGNGATPIAMERFAANDGELPNQLILRAAIPDTFTGGQLGQLYAVLNWRETRQLLEDAVKGSERTALLLDATGMLIASAGPLAGAASTSGKLTDWYRTIPANDIETRSGASLATGDLLVGAATSSGYQHFSGFGWRLLMLEPTSVAFAPIWRLAGVILGLLLFTMMVAGWLSLRLSTRLAQPIGLLTDFARHMWQMRNPSAPQIKTGITEVGELSHAFGEMIEALARSREHLVRAGKLAVMGEMAAIMAHEVRTPLGILKSSAQMLARRPNPSEQDKELTDFIVSETERLNHLVTTLLECASPRPPQFLPHDLHEIIGHVVALIASKLDKQGIVLESHLTADDSILLCDREQMIQVFLNLFINALQHLPEGGHLAVTSQHGTPGLEVMVEDDGTGIAEEDQERVFDPFFTRRDGGIGLGLTIVNQIVEIHGGRITVTKSRWGGACFTIQFGLERQGEPA